MQAGRESAGIPTVPGRVFLGPLEIAGYYGNLAEALISIGVDCETVFYRSHPFGYRGETPPPRLVRVMRRLERWGERPGLRSRPARIVLGGLRELVAWLFLAQCLCRYDTFVFGFGHSLLRSNRDLPILRAFGKRIVAVLGHGSEARPSYIDGGLRSADRGVMPEPEALARRAKEQRAMVRRFERSAHVIIGAPFSTFAFAARPFVNWFAVGVPTLPSAGTPKGGSPVVEPASSPPNSPVRILHAPSHAAAKGSDVIRDAIETLRQRGLPVELEEISGRPHHEVIAALERCDLVVDQVYSDTPMAGFAAEAAAAGKPSLVGGYGLDRLTASLSPDRRPPTVTCRPDSLIETIATIAGSPEERQRIGAAARRFVDGAWSAREVGDRFRRLLSGEPPSEWMLDPASVVYLHGCGLSESDARSAVRSVIDRFGIAGLGLSHRPDLERAYVAFAAGEPS